MHEIQCERLHSKDFANQMISSDFSTVFALIHYFIFYRSNHDDWLKFVTAKYLSPSTNMF